jgi:preprotein translocase SecE subunit
MGENVMAEENKTNTEDLAVEAPVEKKAKKEKQKPKKSNVFVRIWKWLCKVAKDTTGELKKVTWTPKAEVFKSFKLVIATVVAVGVAIAVVDLTSSFIINTIAGLIG